MAELEIEPRFLELQARILTTRPSFVSLSFSFHAPPQSFYFSTLFKKIAFKNPFGNTLGMLWPPQLYLAQL